MAARAATRAPTPDGASPRAFLVPSVLPLPLPPFHLPPCTSTFHLPPSTFRLPPSAFHLRGSTRVPMPGHQVRCLPPSTFHLPPCTFHLARFHLPPSTFRLPPSTFHLPPSRARPALTRDGHPTSLRLHFRVSCDVCRASHAKIYTCVPLPVSEMRGFLHNFNHVPSKGTRSQDSSRKYSMCASNMNDLAMTATQHGNMDMEHGRRTSHVPGVQHTKGRVGFVLPNAEVASGSCCRTLSCARSN